MIKFELVKCNRCKKYYFTINKISEHKCSTVIKEQDGWARWIKMQVK